MTFLSLPQYFKKPQFYIYNLQLVVALAAAAAVKDSMIETEK